MRFCPYRLACCIGALLSVSAAGVGQADLVTTDWVSIGNAGNPADTTGYGSVAYDYLISKHEVTAGQYTAFLNAVAATGTHGLYNANMWSSDYGCKIQQTGTPGNYTYSVAPDRADRPVNYVSFWDACRYANWLHNGQGSGDTETGAYTLSDGSSMTRNAGAQVWIPSKDEWYKAAYHKNDGVTGEYWHYPTGTDDTPGNEIVDPDAGKNANFLVWPNEYTTGGPYWTTEVGEFENSASAYGTSDQGGNVLEWNETLVFGSERGLRGGSWTDPEWAMTAGSRVDFDPSYEQAFVGFRVAATPEPGTIAMLLGLGTTVPILLMRRKART